MANVTLGRILYEDDGCLGLVDVPRVETQSVAEKVAVHQPSPAPAPGQSEWSLALSLAKMVVHYHKL